MFANHPIGFIVSVALCLAGVGIIIFMVWYIRCPGATLTITNEQTTLRKGILSKFTNDSFHENVRNIIVQQTLLHRIFGVARSDCLVAYPARLSHLSGPRCLPAAEL